MLTAGDPAPDFTAVNHHGDLVRSTELRGRPVLLWFYPKADTPGCTIEGKGFCDSFEDLQKQELTVLGVSFDTEEENRAFAEKFDFPFDLLCDTERELGMAYGACDDPEEGYAKRISYLIDKNGLIAKVYANVQPAEHPAEVLKDLTELD